MFDNIRPYNLKRIQRDHSSKVCKLFDECFVYKFFTDKNTKGGPTRYIARAERYGECIAVKFYPQSAEEDYRYSISTNRFSFRGVLQIILTCANLIPILMKKYPNASFIIKASEGIDLQLNTEEPEQNNQRFRIYRYAISKVIGDDHFEHYEYPNVSAYLLLNKKSGAKKDELEKFLVEKFNLEDI